MKIEQLTEGRYRIFQQSDPAMANHLLGQVEQVVRERWRRYQQLAGLPGDR